MKITSDQLSDFPIELFHAKSLQLLGEQLESEGQNIEILIEQIQTFQIAIPSWALGAGVCSSDLQAGHWVQAGPDLGGFRLAVSPEIWKKNWMISVC